MRDLIMEVVHKLRTPVVAIHVSCGGIKHFLPILIDAYNKARECNCDIIEIQEQHLQILTKVINNIENESTFINDYLDELSEMGTTIND